MHVRICSIYIYDVPFMIKEAKGVELWSCSRSVFFCRKVCLSTIKSHVTDNFHHASSTMQVDLSYPPVHALEGQVGLLSLWRKGDKKH